MCVLCWRGTGWAGEGDWVGWASPSVSINKLWDSVRWLKSTFSCVCALCVCVHVFVTPLQSNRLEAVPGRQGCHGDQRSQRWATSVVCFFQDRLSSSRLHPLSFPSASVINVAFQTRHLNRFSNRFNSFIASWAASAQSCSQQSLSLCGSQRGLRVSAHGTRGNLGQRLTPVLSLLPLSMASLSIWTCSVSTALFSWLRYQQRNGAHIRFS